MKNYFAKLKERDENAIKKLYDDYVRLIYHIAYSYTKTKKIQKISLVKCF